MINFDNNGYRTLGDRPDCSSEGWPQSSNLYINVS